MAYFTFAIRKNRVVYLQKSISLICGMDSDGLPPHGISAHAERPSSAEKDANVHSGVF